MQIQLIFSGLSKTSLLGLASTGHRSKDAPAPSTSSSSIQTTSSSNSLSILESNSVLKTILADTRPKVNSILHLFGPWLFEAALAVSELSVVGKERFFAISFLWDALGLNILSTAFKTVIHGAEVEVLQYLLPSLNPLTYHRL